MDVKTSVRDRAVEGLCKALKARSNGLAHSFEGMDQPAISGVMRISVGVSALNASNTACCRSCNDPGSIAPAP